MDFFRGDDRIYSGLKPHGFRAYEPMTAQEARDYVQREVRQRGVSGFAASLRDQSNRKVVATAAVLDGAYQGKNSLYRITPTGSLRYSPIDDQATIGDPVDDGALRKFDCFVIYDADLWSSATMIAFGHPRIIGTQEVTFLTQIPMSFISGCKTGANTNRNEVPFAPMLTKPGNTFAD